MNLLSRLICAAGACFVTAGSVVYAGEPAGPVTEADVIDALQKLDASEQTALAKDPALLQQVAQLMLTQRLLLSEARRQKWDERPDVQSKMERAREKALAESWLQSATEPPADYPSEAELKSAYEAMRPSLERPRQFRIAQIFIAMPQTADREAAARATAKLARVKKQMASYERDFSEIAGAESEDASSAAAGGEIGWLSEAQVQPELRPLVTKLLKHEVSEPVRLKDGWHILKCLDKREAGAPPLEEVRPSLTTRLRAEKTKANSEALVARLLKENPVTLNEVALSGAVNRQSK